MSFRDPLRKGHARRAKRRLDEVPGTTHGADCTTTYTEARDHLERTLTHHIHDANEDLMDTLFDIEASECNGMLEKLAERGLWSPQSRSWVHLPSHPDTEESLYTPLADIANAVSELDYSTNPRSDGSILTWRISHSAKLESYWPGSYANFLDLIAELEPVTPTTVSFDARHHEQPSWNRVIVPGKVKKRKKVYTDIVQLQLAHCVRQMYKGQPDRRFIFGFTFEFVFLTVWYFDRSGVLASRHINVHKSPLLLVQFLLGCTRMSAVDFGFDPTFLWYKDEHTHLPSYRIPLTVVRGGFETLPWIFEMPEEIQDVPGTDPAGTPHKRRNKFITFRALKTNRVEMMVGRATRVWLAYSMDDFLKALDDGSPNAQANFKVYVLKVMWHDTGRVPEGSLYCQQGHLDGVVKYYSSEAVTIGDEVDTTKRCRKGMETTGQRVCLKKDSPPLHRYDEDYPHMQATLSDEELIEWIDVLKLDTTNPQEFPYVSRTYYRVLLQSFGHPLTDFLSREDLLVSFADAINGHKNMVDAGFLHRDISSGNIMITDQPSPNHGILIDQDYTIPVDPNYECSDEDLDIGTPPFVAVELLNREPFIYAWYLARGPVPEYKKIRPQAIHDLESFYWVLCWICIMWDGPSTPRCITGDDDQEAWEEANRLFSKTDAVDSAMTKVVIITGSSMFEYFILRNLSPFFCSLAPLLLRLRMILYNVYRTFEFDGVHEAFIEAINEQIETLKTSTDPIETRYDTIKARRRVERLANVAGQRMVKPRSVSEEERARIEERVAEIRSEMAREREINFRAMVRRAEIRRARRKFQRPPQFLDTMDARTETSSSVPVDDDERPHKRAKGL